MNYVLFLLGYSITRALPIRVAYALSSVLADLHCMFSTDDRKAVESNLKIVLNCDQVHPEIVRQVFRNFGKYLVEFFTMTKHFNAAFIKNHVKLSGSEKVDDVLRRGKGCIMVSAHYGNWELPAAMMSSLGYPVSVVALPHKDLVVNKMFNAQREFFGTTVIPTTTAIRRCMEHLQANKIVALLSERDFGQHGLVMDFFGKPTMIPKGAALFSIKTGAPIIPCFFVRLENNDFEVRHADPIYPPDINTKATDEDLRTLMEKYIKIFEVELRRNPTQWLLFRKFWFA